VVLPKARERALPARFVEDDDIRFTERLAQVFIELLTSPGDVVLDPFAGFGTTLVAAERLHREGWGIEIDAERGEYVRTCIHHPDRLLIEDARRLGTFDLPRSRLVLTSPPYSNPSDPDEALSGYTAPTKGYGEYLAQLTELFADLRDSMLPRGWIIVEVSNLRHEDGRLTLLAWDVARALGEVIHFVGEVVVGWKPKYGYGYDHSYCLVFSPTPLDTSDAPTAYDPSVDPATR
jgi:hypothetical protein